MSESDLSEPVLSHESAFIDIAVHAVEPSLSGVLPHLEVPAVSEHGLTLGVLRYHELVVVEHALQIGVVEIRARVNEWALPVGFLHKDEKLGQGVAKFLAWHSAACLHVNHGQ